MKKAGMVAAVAALFLVSLTACGTRATSDRGAAQFPGFTPSPTTTDSPVATPAGGVALVPTSCPVNAATAASGQPVTGTVYYDKNQDGQQNPGEPGLAGIPVYLSGSADSETPGGEKPASSCTDADGHYRLIPPDTNNGFRVYFRTGWFRTQCPGLTCPTGGPGDNVAAGPEWIYSDAVTGKTSHQFDVGLIPDAGQYVVDIHSKDYSAYPPDLSRAHPLDLAVRFTDDEATNCKTTTNGVSCHLGQPMSQTLYIVNSGLTPVSGIQAVMQLPWGEQHQTLQILRTGTSPEITGITDVTVTPAQGPRASGQKATVDNYTTITFTLQGTIPPAGLIAVMSTDLLAQGTPGTQIIGHAGITAEDNASSDTDSAFCTDPALSDQCASIANTHSFLDQAGDDNDSDRFNVLAAQ